MAFELPPLPFSTGALAGAGMCQETLELHHGKHHQAYVTALNGFVETDPSLQGKSLDEIVTGQAHTPGPVFNNAGQHWNHIIFWQNLSPTGGKIPSALQAKIDEDLGGTEKFREAFKAAAATQFGSGWAWLVLGDGRQAEGHQDAERVESAGDRRRQGSAGARCVGAQLLSGLPQPPARLCDELPRQARQLRIRRRPAARLTARTI